MAKSIYVTDLDGTLLDNSAKLTEDLQYKINMLIDEGVFFTIASARSYKTIKKILSKVKFNLPIIEFNGGYITDFETGKHLVINNINENIAKELYFFIKTVEMEPLISTFDGEIDQLFYLKSTSDGMAKYIDDREINLDCKLPMFAEFTEISDYKIMCFTLIDEKQKILNLRDQLNRKFGVDVIVDAWEDMYYKPWYWLSVHSKESTKAKAIKKLCELNDIAYDLLITFGDNSNDIEMFKISDRSYAVENAVDELKEIAYEVIGLNTDNSVINKILILEEGKNDII